MAITRRRKKKTHKVEDIDPSKKGDPKSFVFRRGKHGMVVADLEQDLRRMMLPNTAINLKESKRNVLKDFVSVAGPLGVTHFLILTATDRSTYLKVCKTPRGPTLTMRISSYSLIRDVQASLARPRVPQNAFKTPPLVVMNNFGGEEHMKLATVLFQNLFPAINVLKTKLAACQRVVLLQFDKETGKISLRHYSIGVAPSGLKKSIKGLVQGKALPDMSDMQDVSEFVSKSGFASESEGEEAEASRVTLAQDMGKGNVAARQSRVRLYEIGPRMELEIVKVEEGMCDGKVLYHAHVKRSATEIKAQQAQKDERERLRGERRQDQEGNVKKKKMDLARKEAVKAAGKMREAGKLPEKKQWWELELAEDSKRSRETFDDDAQYYEDEVGQAPGADEKIGMRDPKYGRERGGARFGSGVARWGPPVKDTDEYVPRFKREKKESSEGGGDDGGGDGDGAGDGGGGRGRGRSSGRGRGQGQEGGGRGRNGGGRGRDGGGRGRDGGGRGGDGGGRSRGGGGRSRGRG